MLSEAGNIDTNDSPNRGLKRQRASAVQFKQGERMKKYAGGRPDTYTALIVGTVVKVSVNKVDRGKTDPLHVPGVVVAVTDHNNYRIACKGGILKDCLSRGDLIVEEKQTALLYGLEEYTTTADISTIKTISVRQALANISPVGGQGVFKCSCKGKCDSNKCACFKASHICNSRCHSNNSKCSNCGPA